MSSFGGKTAGLGAQRGEAQEDAYITWNTPCEINGVKGEPSAAK